MAVPPHRPPLIACRAALVAVLLALGLVATAPALAQAATDATADAAASAAGGEDIRMLEQQVQAMLTEARRQQVQLTTQRQRLAAAEAANAWLPLLFMALAALGLLCGALGLRLWRVQRQLARLQASPPGAARAGGAAPAGPMAAADAPGARLPERPLLGNLGHAAVRMPVDLALSAPRPGPLLGGELTAGGREFGFGTGVPPRSVSVEELLDLDQQVEFFLALGQAQSAIDLLLGHVRSTGGTNAQPYFKLLEIYRAQGDEEAYERTRERFNQRFNALAPDWTGDMAAGRALEDYPEVLQRLQRAWPQPARAVAELDGLLLRRADLEPFDLPAYREVLMLHALARDLPAADPDGLETPVPPPAIGQSTTPAVLAREQPLEPVHGDADALLPAQPAPDAQPADDRPAALADRPAGATVDLLLPLGESSLDITLPQPHRGGRPLVQAMLAEWVFSRSSRTPADAADAADGSRPGAPARLDLDLDLSEHAPAPREFTRPAAFTDIDMRRDRRLSDLGGLDDADPLRPGR